jgi:hypothetical protein
LDDWAHNRVKILQEFGQSVWLDDLRRSFVRNGDLARLIGEDGISGVSSTPMSFAQAIAADPFPHAAARPRSHAGPGRERARDGRPDETFGCVAWYCYKRRAEDSSEPRAGQAHAAEARG